MWTLGLFIATLVTVAITHWVYRWQNPKCNGKLPPGSMGWPLLGETLHFFAPNPTWDTPPFIKKRIQRFGSIFRTSFVGMKVIVSTDGDLNYTVFQQEDKFQSWYPPSMTRVFGEQNPSELHGYLHKYLKNMILHLVGYGGLKKMLPELENEAIKNMEKWIDQGPTVELNAAIANMIFGLTSRKLISYDIEKSTSESITDNYEAFMKGLISVPIPIPGTAFYNCLQGRKKVMTLLKNMLAERRENPNKVNEDFFDFVVEELKQDGTIVTEGVALDMMFILLFASYETTTLALLVAIKLLSENPKALKELTEENEKILENRDDPESGLTWEEYKSMKFTFQVINESVRLANIVPGIFRKALTDIKFKDYTIPSGWVVMVCPPAVHLDSTNYKDPLDFNPWRWENMDFKGTSKTFMAFGGGQRFCVGADFSRLQMAVFLHRLVIKYRWELINAEIVRTPGLQFPNGVHVKFFEKVKKNK